MLTAEIGVFKVFFRKIAGKKKKKPPGAYRGQFQRHIGLGPGLVLDNLTLECRETFTSAVTCPYHAWKHGKVLISTKKLMKKRGISWNFADLAVRSQRGKSASRSVLTAKRPDLSAQSPTRAQKKPHTALETMARA